MVLCFVALLVFGVLGIFSAKYRQLARDAFKCVFRMATLRPCDTNFDERMKAAILAKTMAFSPKIARFINQRFAALSLVFTLLFFGSLAYSTVSVYNYWAYGNCNGPNSNAFCVFDVLGADSGRELKSVPPGKGPTLGSGNLTLIEFGCFSCPFTKLAQPGLREFVSRRTDVKLEFRSFPIPTHDFSREAAEAAFCAEEQGKFWEYHDLLFEKQGEINPENLKAFAVQLGLSSQQFNSCFDSKKFAWKVDRDFEEGKAAGIYGTPTFFINESVLVGPQTWEDFEKASREKITAGAGGSKSCPAPK